MTYGITWIPYGRITGVLPQLLPYLAKSEYYAHGRNDVDDIVKNLYSGQDLLWAVYEEESEKIIGFVITEIKQYPQSKMLFVKYLAGDIGTLEGAEEVVYSTIERFAKDTRCDGIESIGRFGWKPRAKKHGYTPYMVMYEKFFE